MPQNGTMAQAAKTRFGESLDQAIPRLIRELRTPYLVAVELGVYANSVRHWLTTHGWVNKDGEWIAPQAESQP